MGSVKNPPSIFRPCVTLCPCQPQNKYIYGCSVSGINLWGRPWASSSRSIRSWRLTSRDLFRKTSGTPPPPPTLITGYVDGRSIAEIVTSSDPQDPIKVFMIPEWWYAQESRFVPRNKGSSEDEGWILSYVFDEIISTGLIMGSVLASAKSELWVIDAKNMKDVLARVYLPQRVPYGLHRELVFGGASEESKGLWRVSEACLSSNLMAWRLGMIRKRLCG